MSVLDSGKLKKWNLLGKVKYLVSRCRFGCLLFFFGSSVLLVVKLMIVGIL